MKYYRVTEYSFITPNHTIFYFEAEDIHEVGRLLWKTLKLGNTMKFKFDEEPEGVYNYSFDMLGDYNLRGLRPGLIEEISASDFYRKR